MGAIQGKINNLLGSFGAVAYATNKYNQGVIASEDKALKQANENYEVASNKAKLEGQEVMENAIKDFNQQQAKKKQQAKLDQITRLQALQKTMPDVQEIYTQRKEFEQRMKMAKGRGPIGYAKE